MRAWFLLLFVLLLISLILKFKKNFYTCRRALAGGLSVGYWIFLHFSEYAVKK